MLNLIRMNLCKLVKTKSYYVVTIITSLYILIGAWGNSVSSGINEMNMFEYIDSFFCNTFVLMIYTVFVALFSVNEFSSGYIKSFATQVHGKTKIVFAKMISLFVAQVIWTVFSIGLMLISFNVFNDMTFSLESDHLVTFGVVSLYYFAFTVMLIAIGYVFRSKVSSVVGCLVLTDNIVGLFAILADMVIEHYMDVNAKIENYFLTSNFININYGMSDSTIERIVIICIGAIILYTSLAVLSIRKKDIS